MSPWAPPTTWNALRAGFEDGLRRTLGLQTPAHEISTQIRRARWYGDDMGPDAIAKGLAEGWLTAEEGGWYRFVWDFVWDPKFGKWTRIPAQGIKRVRVLEKGDV